MVKGNKDYNQAFKIGFFRHLSNNWVTPPDKETLTADVSAGEKVNMECMGNNTVTSTIDSNMTLTLYG